MLVTTLTKRMAEDLTEYLAEHGVKVRYLHSDVDNIERVEIIRDLRLGEFDVLVGINLLREGLDLPEVSLVAILDADKEGFLRSERSLIQTIGRAARHINGTAILYADQITESMQEGHRRDRPPAQQAGSYNERHGITPKGVVKRIKDLIDGVYDAAEARRRRSEEARFEAMSEKQLAREIRALEKKMLEHARNLEFEEAAARARPARRAEEAGLRRGARLGVAKCQGRIGPREGEGLWAKTEGRWRAGREAWRAASVGHRPAPARASSMRPRRSTSRCSGGTRTIRDALHFLGVLRHQQGRSLTRRRSRAPGARAAPRLRRRLNNLGNIHQQLDCPMDAIAVVPESARAAARSSRCLAQSRHRAAKAEAPRRGRRGPRARHRAKPRQASKTTIRSPARTRRWAARRRGRDAEQGARDQAAEPEGFGASASCCTGLRRIERGRGHLRGVARASSPDNPVAEAHARRLHPERRAGCARATPMSRGCSTASPRASTRCCGQLEYRAPALVGTALAAHRRRAARRARTSSTRVAEPDFSRRTCAITPAAWSASTSRRRC